VVASLEVAEFGGCPWLSEERNGGIGAIHFFLSRFCRVEERGRNAFCFIIKLCSLFEWSWFMRTKTLVELRFIRAGSIHPFSFGP
jgi:hypothetical protein